MKRNKASSVHIIMILVSHIAFSSYANTDQRRLYFGHEESAWVKNTMATMTLEEKIGQMVTCRYSGYFVNIDSEYVKQIESLIMERKIGGLILFGGDVLETAYLTNTFQNKSKIPLLIASDFERGAANQIEGATLFPPLMAIGAIGSEEAAYSMGRITALEGRAMGIHMTYAPVVDVNINPENPIINVRSFGEDPERVSRLAKAFIKGCQEYGLIATAKHFPGHGDTELDSHLELPTVKADRKRLDQVELYPFKKAVEAGVQAIMTTHIYFPSLDSTPNLPATLSPQIITELLRNEFGFKGLIVTDAMDMGGVTNLYSPEESAKKAVQAGVDMVLIPPEVEQVIEALIQAVSSGVIQEARIDASVKRILEVKAMLGLHKNKLVEAGVLKKVISSPEHSVEAMRLFENSMTLVKNEKNILPLPETPPKLAVFSLSSDPGEFFAGRVFISGIEERYPEIMSFYADCYTGEDYIREGLEKAREADLIIIALFSRRRAWKGTVDLEPRHIQAVQETVKGSPPVIVVSFGSPYFIRHFPEVNAYLCAFQESPQAQKTAVKALFGDIELRGKLPVTLPGLFPLDHGLVLPKKGENQ
ncbi:MAG: glycoside hydrolase family 3 protein [Candidatus Aminicenantes bacterium]|nr:glycoside hydrolase family 3 protein [Candidatus Aminicenantes bacterium]